MVVKGVIIVDFDDHKHIMTTEDYDLVKQGKLKLCRRCLVGVYA
jgi:hypothetical protein